MKRLIWRTTFALTFIAALGGCGRSGNKEPSKQEAASETDEDSVAASIQSKLIALTAQKGPSNPALKLPPMPPKIMVENRGELSVETLKKELLAEGVKEQIVSGIGDGKDPIFQEGRYGVRPPDDLMEIVKDFAGWKLYAEKRWFSNDKQPNRNFARHPWRDRALRIEYPYEVIVARPELFVDPRAQGQLSEKSFSIPKCWAFPLSDKGEITSQLTFGYFQGRWQPGVCFGVPSDVLKIEHHLNLYNAPVRRLSIVPFHRLVSEDIVGYVPKTGSMADGVYYYREKEPPQRIKNKPVASEHLLLQLGFKALSFKELEKVLFDLALKYNLKEDLQRAARRKMEGGKDAAK